MESKRKSRVVKDIKIPVALKPGVDWDGYDNEITSEVLDGPEPDWENVLTKWGFDPDTHEVVEPIKVSQWEALIDGEVKQLFSYKGTVKRRQEIERLDYLDLVREVKKHRKLDVSKLSLGTQALVVNIADTQFGKNDFGGTNWIIKNFVDSIDRVDNRIRELRKLNRDLGLLVIAFVGDLIEGCAGNYAAQTYRVEMNRRQQVRIARRLFRDAICRWSKLGFKEVWVLSVPGNHGENRSGFKLYTTPGDNDDLAVIEQVSDILAANPEAYGHVKFFIPEDDIWIATEVFGKKIGWTHGHITGGSGTPQQKLKNWWSEQAFTGTDIGNCEILVSGHYHHFSYINYDKNKTHVQCPSLDDGSEWWVDMRGQDSFPGMLTFTLNENGMNDIQIL